MRRAAVLLVAVFLLAGCGVLNKQELTPAPQTLTHGRFVYLADHICARDIQKSKQVLKQKPKKHAQFDAKLQAVLKGYEQLLFDLRALAPPASDAKEFQRVLASFNYEDLLGHNLLQAADQGQVTRVKTLLKKLDAADKDLKVRALQLGLHTCARE